jgi:histone acetyltransferase
MDGHVENNYYKSLDEFVNDFQKIIDNCRKFNDVKSVYVKCANKLESFFQTRLKAAENLAPLYAG